MNKFIEYMAHEVGKLKYLAIFSDPSTIKHFEATGPDDALLYCIQEANLVDEFDEYKSSKLRQETAPFCVMESSPQSQLELSLVFIIDNNLQVIYEQE